VNPGDERAATDHVRARLGDNLATIRGRIAEACRRAGRDPAGVTLVAVTKQVDVAVARLLPGLGCADLAEGRPQGIWTKAEALADLVPPVRWHLVGHLQRNKIRRTLPRLTMLQSLDSLRLLEALEAEAAAGSGGCELLVEVNLAADAARSGAAPAEVPELVRAAVAARHLRLRGLMAMARHPDDPAADPRRDFAALRTLRDDLLPLVPDPESLATLSMGMSGDFEAGILEGATLVRIGSALFEGLA